MCEPLWAEPNYMLNETKKKEKGKKGRKPEVVRYDLSLGSYNSDFDLYSATV